LGILIGGVAGSLSGMFGIGGGLLIVPACVILLGFDQKLAQGTSLATLLAPVGILAVLNYHKEEKVSWMTALFLGTGFILGALGGSVWALSVNEALVRRSCAVFLVAVAIYLWFKPGPPA
jgi:uncharacterized protein